MPVNWLTPIRRAFFHEVDEERMFTTRSRPIVYTHFLRSSRLLQMLTVTTLRNAHFQVRINFELMYFPWQTIQIKGLQNAHQKWHKHFHLGIKLMTSTLPMKAFDDTTCGQVRTYLVLQAWATCRFRHGVFFFCKRRVDYLAARSD